VFFTLRNEQGEQVIIDRDRALVAVFLRSLETGAVFFRFLKRRRGEKGLDSNFNRRLHYRNLGIA